MAKITCAITGIKFSVSYLESIIIPHTQGYFHPVFALSHGSLYKLYTSYTKGELSTIDSYLLFMAFLHSSDQISWEHPAALDPHSASTKKLIANQITLLIRVLEQSAIINHPRFNQPSYRMTYETSALYQIPFWIDSWADNLDRFNRGYVSERLREELQAVENKLSALILSGEEPAKYAGVIANWAELAADFPPHKAELYKKTIRSCFSITKMFNTPLPLLKELKEYCEANIDPGSIHFHTLCEVIREGINKHVDYLGGSSLALGYTLLPNSDGLPDKGQLINDAELTDIIANAPLAPPDERDYPDKAAYIKAKLAYKVKMISKPITNIDI